MTLDAMKERQKRMQTIWIVMIAVLLLAILVVLGLILWRLFAGGDSSGSPLQIFATQTYTPTITPTPITPTLTLVPTETETPTITLTPTPEGPLKYTVQEGDTVFKIADQYDIYISQLNAYNLEQGTDISSGILRVGQELFIPAKDYQEPTNTPFPDDVKPGTKVDYVVRAGDILYSLALEFNTTIAAIQEANPDIGDSLEIGQVLKIPYNVVALTPIPATATPFPTRAPTATATPES